MIVVPMAEEWETKVKRSDPESECRGWQGSGGNKNKCCNCEVRAKLSHDPAPAKSLQQKRTPPSASSKARHLKPANRDFVTGLKQELRCAKTRAPMSALGQKRTHATAAIGRLILCKIQSRGGSTHQLPYRSGQRQRRLLSLLRLDSTAR